MAEPPIACRLTAEELREREQQLLPGLLAAAVRRVALEDGYRWEFDGGAGVLERIASIIEEERRCCPFSRFRVTAEPASGPVFLEVTGPEGTRELLDKLSRR